MQMLSQTWKVHVYNVVDVVFIIILNMLHPEWHSRNIRNSAINRPLQNSVLLPFIILSTCIQVKHTYPSLVMAIMMIPLHPKLQWWQSWWHPYAQRWYPYAQSYNDTHPKLSVVTCSKITEDYIIWKAVTNYHWSHKIKETAHKKSKTCNDIY